MQQASEVDFKKKHTMANNNESYKAEYKTSKDAVNDLSPLNFRAHLEETKKLTPEEYETILNTITEFKANAKLYSLTFGLTAFAFLFWQRRFVPTWYMILATGSGSLAGATYGCLRTSWYFVESVDKLGKDYELSRMIKQDIFDSRPDLDSSTRVNYYMYQ